MELEPLCFSAIWEGDEVYPLELWYFGKILFQRKPLLATATKFPWEGLTGKRWSRHDHQHRRHNRHNRQHHKYAPHLVPYLPFLGPLLDGACGQKCFANL